MTDITQSEQAFRDWCAKHDLHVRRIRPANAQGARRPDFAIASDGKWCIAEIKELAPAKAGPSAAPSPQISPYPRFVDPKKKLTKVIGSAADQLRAFSKRGLPTVVCVFDVTGFLLSGEHLVPVTLFGRDVVTVLGGRRKNAAFNKEHNTSVSALAIFSRVDGSSWQIDFYHNPYARVPIPPAIASPFVRWQSAPQQEQMVWSMLRAGSIQEWTEEELDTRIAAILSEIRNGKA